MKFNRNMAEAPNNKLFLMDIGGTTPVVACRNTRYYPDSYYQGEYLYAKRSIRKYDEWENKYDAIIEEEEISWDDKKPLGWAPLPDIEYDEPNVKPKGDEYLTKSKNLRAVAKERASVFCAKPVEWREDIENAPKDRPILLKVKFSRWTAAGYENFGFGVWVEEYKGWVYMTTLPAGYYNVGHVVKDPVAWAPLPEI